MENELRQIIKEEVDKFLLKEYSTIAPYKHNLLKLTKDLSDYFKEIKQDIIARKNLGDTRASLHDSTFIAIENDIKKLADDIMRIN